MSMFSRRAGELEQRARDLQRTLTAFDGAPLLHDDFAPVLASFQKLSQQLTLLHERGAAPENQALLERHFVVPSAASGPEAVALVPHLLSSRLDKEQEEEDADLRRRAEAAGSHLADWSEDQHNELVEEACAHLEAAASAHDLPRASQRGAVGGASSVATATASSMGSAVAAGSASSLVNALRTGKGLEARSTGGRADATASLQTSSSTQDRVPKRPRE